MKKWIIITGILLVSGSCSKGDSNRNDNINYRQEMRNFVGGISQYSKAMDPGFIVIPQNGIQLVTINGEENGSPDTNYLASIDGNGQEDLFYGYENDDQATPANEISYLQAFLNISKHAGKTILVTDYCSTPANVDNSYALNNAVGYIGFAAPERELNVIPGYPFMINGENNATVVSLDQVKNFLYLINTENYLKKSFFINAVISTNYDLLIIDLFFTSTSEFSAGEVEELRAKANGGRRLVIAYLSIGEAETYRYYWQPGWYPGNPAWLDAENPDWPGNFKVKYWNPEWQGIIFGNDNSYIKKILDAGFDGVYLDIVDGFEYFEQ
jgi:cysteinyl-tRNA synthetase